MRELKGKCSIQVDRNVRRFWTKEGRRQHQYWGERGDSRKEFNEDREKHRGIEPRSRIP